MWQYSTYGEELYHYKYIKREFKNGRWVYTYPGDAMNNAYQKQLKIAEEARRGRTQSGNLSTSEAMARANAAIKAEKKANRRIAQIRAADKALRSTASALDKLSDAKYKASKKAKSTMKKTVTKVKQQTDKGKAKIRSILLRRTSK